MQRNVIPRQLKDMYTLMIKSETGWFVLRLLCIFNIFHLTQESDPEIWKGVVQPFQTFLKGRFQPQLFEPFLH